MSKLLSNIARVGLSWILASGGFLASGVAFAEVASDSATSLENYDVYKSQVQSVCKDFWANFWENAASNRILNNTISYAKIGDPNGVKTYIDATKKFDASIASTLSFIGKEPVVSDMKKAEAVYVSRMNAIFACSILDAKIRTTDKIMRVLPRTQDSEIFRALEAQKKRFGEMKSERWCNTKASEGTSTKLIILDNATFEYCNYRHYLGYLNESATRRINEVMSSGSTAPISSTSLAIQIQSTTSQIDSAISHAREVFPKAMLAYSEFERYYGSHVVLLFILDDYIKYRATLRDVMNPLSQMLYKGSGAGAQYRKN